MPRVRLALAILVAVGCVPLPTPQAAAPISLTAVASDVEYAPYQAKGTGTISGQAFLTTRGGDVKVAAGREVTLDPSTTYSREWYSHYGTAMSRWAEAPGDPKFAGARRTTTADAQGKFRFTDLPAGEYIVRTTVTWEVPSSSYLTNTQGGVVSMIVKLNGGEAKDVILNQT